MDREERLRRRRELYRLRRAEETPQEREVRLARRRERERVRRATLSAEQRQSIQDQRRERYHHSRNPDNPIEVTVRAAACPKYPESKDRVPKSFSFIPRACVFRLAPRCSWHLSS